MTGGKLIGSYEPPLLPHILREEIPAARDIRVDYLMRCSCSRLPARR